MVDALVRGVAPEKHPIGWARDRRPSSPLQASARLCPRPVPATLFALLGATLKSSTLCAKAVHTNPAEPALWSQLHACATSLSAE